MKTDTNYVVMFEERAEFWCIRSGAINWTDFAGKANRPLTTSCARNLTEPGKVRFSWPLPSRYLTIKQNFSKTFFTAGFTPAHYKLKLLKNVNRKIDRIKCFIALIQNTVCIIMNTDKKYNWFYFLYYKYKFIMFGITFIILTASMHRIFL